MGNDWSNWRDSIKLFVDFRKSVKLWVIVTDAVGLQMVVEAFASNYVVTEFSIEIRQKVTQYVL